MKPMMILAMSWSLVTGALPAHAADYKAMSFNIRFGTARDGENHWSKRQHIVAKVIRDHRPDLVGMQEVLAFQRDELLEQCPGYACVGGGQGAAGIFELLDGADA